MLDYVLSSNHLSCSTRYTIVNRNLVVRNMNMRIVLRDIDAIDHHNQSMSKPKLNIVLYNPEIPPNTGNIGRSCVALGAKLWLIEPLGFDLGEKAIRRSGMDYWQYLDLEVVPDWHTVLENIPNFNPWLFTKYGTKSHTSVTYCQGDTLVFGSESSGLPDFVHEAFPSRQLRIPMTSTVRSINLATAVGIAMYEFNRQVPLVTV